MSDRAKAIAAVENYLAKMAAGDLEGIMAAYGPEPTVNDPIGSEPKVGREAVEAFYASVLPFKPRTTLLGPITVTGRYAGFQFRMELTIGDSEVVVYATELFALDDDFLISEMTAVPDLEAAG